jgi:tetratricopeptide (TPR) repeat protein
MWQSSGNTTRHNPKGATTWQPSGKFPLPPVLRVIPLTEKTTIPYTLEGKNNMNEKLMAARLKQGWSMRRAADAVRVGYRTWRYWEVEGHDPSLDSLRLIMDVFGCSAEELGYGYLVMAQVSPVRQEGADIRKQDQATESCSLEQPSLTRRVTHSEFMAESTDSTTWFSERVAQIISLIYQWRAFALSCTHLQQIISQEFMMFEKYVNPLDHLEELRLSRRNALMVLAALPAGMLASSGSRQSVLPAAELLPSCTASVTACWHLMAGRDFTAVERALSQYFSLLVTWAQQPSANQRTAAYLAAQGYLLLGLVSLHQLSTPKNFQQRFFYCRQAVEYAQAAGDPSLMVASLLHLGGAASDLGQLSDTLGFHQQALREVNAISPFLQSKLYAETAYSYARNGQIPEALSNIGKARDLFPGEGVKDVPSYLSTDYGFFALTLFEGQTLLDLGKHEDASFRGQMHYAQAQTALARIEQFSPKLFFPERFCAEIVNHQALTAIKMGNLEQFRVYLIDGARRAKVLHSAKRQQEVLANWREARKVWPREPLVTELADLLLE